MLSKLESSQSNICLQHQIMNQEIQPEIKFVANSQFSQQNSQPWITNHTRSIAHPIVRMHNQMIDFVNYVEPDEHEHSEKKKILEKFSQQIRSIMPGTQISNPFLKNKLYLKNTQLQIFVIVNYEQDWQQNVQRAMQKIAQNIGLKIYNLSIQITEHQCRFITYYTEKETQVWIRFVTDEWKLFISEIDHCVANSPELKYLFLVVTCMIRQRSLHLSLRSLLIYGMCGYFIYQRRKQRTRTLTQNMIKFMEYFSVSFSQQDKQRKIGYRQGNIYTCIMSSDKTFTFHISEKVDLSTRKVREFFKLLHNRYKVLGNYYYPPGTSVLKHLINPCSGKFFY